MINERDIAKEAGTPINTWRRQVAPGLREHVPALFDSRIRIYDRAQVQAHLDDRPLPKLPDTPHSEDLLDDEEAAALLGVTPSTVRAYATQGYLPTGTTVYGIRLWARRSIQERLDAPSRQGQGGGRPAGPTGPTKAHPYEGDPRLTLAAQALTAAPDAPRTRLAQVLANRHGASTRTWERLLAQAAARTPAQ
ncbi:DNA-binding protein [Streptomyces diastaticus]|uniref:DNA-binding protein n=1 Tax=Streptomyces diastaticus TaxID=1956 RepID=UPI003D167939